MRKVFSFSFIWQIVIYCNSFGEKKMEGICNARTKEEKSHGISNFHTMKPASKLNQEAEGKGDIASFNEVLIG